MRRLTLSASLVAGLIAINTLRTVDGETLAAPAAVEAVSQEYRPDTNFDGIIQNRIVLGIGDHPDSMEVVSRPVVISRSGATAHIEVAGSDGKTIRLEIVSQVVKEAK
ncbi:MAG: hypothetical protein AAGD07_13805 [Planctomycetota bacterium]